MDWRKAKRNPRGYEQAAPEQSWRIRSLDECQRPVRDAMEVATRIGNERAGIKTDCLRCFRQVRRAISLEPRGSRRVFRCSECGARWHRVGEKIILL